MLVPSLLRRVVLLPRPGPPDHLVVVLHFLVEVILEHLLGGLAGTELLARALLDLAQAVAGLESIRHVT